uniref:Bromo domain-containing protein n=1 Tax=Globodera rostochiensis TaxID=31243 RepID=A0A914I7V8_GLORO
MRGVTRRKNRQPALQDDSGSSNGDKTTPASDGPPEEWRLEAAIVSLLTLTDGDNRLICPPFRVLPTPEEFPLYYEHVKNPIDLKRIAERVRAGHYTDWAALEADIQLMCQNAKDFNESGSMVHKDSALLLNQFRMRAGELAEARRFSTRVLARNKENIDELLRSTASEVDQFSEDSEEDEDSERSDDLKWRLYWTIRNFDVVDGVPLCENFMELPSKRSYPDYYEEIERPMSLYMINKKLKRDQICCIYEAAQRLRKLTLQMTKKLEDTIKMTSQKGPITVKQEVEDEEKQQQHSPVSTSPKLNGTVPPSAKRRKIVSAVPVRLPLKREASTKGQKAIKQMVDSDFDEFDDDVHQQQGRPQQQGMNSNEQLQQRTAALNKKKTDEQMSTMASAKPSLSIMSEKCDGMDNCANSVPSAASATAPKQRYNRAPRRVNTDGTPMERLKPGRKSVDELREKFAQKLTAVWQDVCDLKMGNRSLSEPFLYLPCEKAFPDYYRTIAKPISLMCIQRKIKEQRYADSDELLADLRLIFARMLPFWNRLRRTDKEWTEQSSIEKSPLKMKKKGAAIASTNATNSSTAATTNCTPSSSHSSVPAAILATPVPNAVVAMGDNAVNGCNNTKPQPNQHQQIVVQQQQPQMPSSSISAAKQHFFPSTSALINGMPPNATVQQVLNGGTIAASSSTSAQSTTAAVSHLQQQLQHAQAVQQQSQFQSNSAAHVQPSLSTTTVATAALSQQLPGTSSHAAANASTTMVQQQQQLIIDPGRTVVKAVPKMADPVFVEPSTSVKVQRVLHSEAYVRYIESMYNGVGGNKAQRTVSKWDKNLQATQRNTTSSTSVHFGGISSNSANRRQLAQDWIRLSSNGSKHREEELMRALWKLRDQLIEGTTGIARHAELPADEPPTAPSSSGTSASANFAQLLHECSTNSSNRQYYSSVAGTARNFGTAHVTRGWATILTTLLSTTCPDLATPIRNCSTALLVLLLVLVVVVEKAAVDSAAASPTQGLPDEGGGLEAAAHALCKYCFGSSLPVFGIVAVWARARALSLSSSCFPFLLPSLTEPFLCPLLYLSASWTFGLPPPSLRALTLSLILGCVLQLIYALNCAVQRGVARHKCQRMNSERAPSLAAAAAAAGRSCSW